MTTIPRRTVLFGSTAAALAARQRPAVVRAADAELSGYVVATKLTGEEAPIVLNLAAGTETALDLPPLSQLYPVFGSAYGIAAYTDTLLVLDAAGGTAREITPAPGTTFGQPLGGRALFPPYVLPSFRPDRYTLLAEGNLVTFLVDLERATAFDLTVFAGNDRYFQAASFTPDGRRLLLANSQSVVLIDLATMEPERTLVASDDPIISSAQLSPDGTKVAFAQRTGQGGAATIQAASLDGEPEIVADIPGGFASLRWITDDALVMVTIEDSDSTLERRNVATGRSTRIGVVAGVPASVEVIARGTRAVVWSEPGDARQWNLLDVAADKLIPLPELDGLMSLGPVSRDAQAVLLGPQAYAVTGQAGERYAVLNAATGAVTTTVDRLEEQYHTLPTFSPDLRSVALGVTGSAGEQLWLLDMVSGALVTIPDYLGAQFAPDGRSVLTRKVGRDEPLEILSLDGALLRELGQYDRGWWLAENR